MGLVEGTFSLLSRHVGAAFHVSERGLTTVRGWGLKRHQEPCSAGGPRAPGGGGNAAFLSRCGGQFGIAAVRGGLWRLFCPLPARGHHRGAPGRGRTCPGLTIGADHTGVLTVLAMALQPAQGPALSQRWLRPRALHLVQHDRARAWWHSKEDGGWEGGAGALCPGGKGLCTGAAPPEALQRQESGRGRSGLQAS